MNHNLQRVFRQLILKISPFLILGIAIAFGIGLLILFYYVLLWGIAIGCFLWLISLVKRRFQKDTFVETIQKKPHPHKPRGRIIDQ